MLLKQFLAIKDLRIIKKLCTHRYLKFVNNKLNIDCMVSYLKREINIKNLLLFFYSSKSSTVYS